MASMLPLFDGFTDADDVLAQFGVDPDPAIDIRIAIYDQGSYEGSAIVVFWKDGTLFEVNDSHCSCNGLENWNPEETTFESLRVRGIFVTAEHQIALDALEEERRA